jgi:hypothetical protein
VSVTKCGESEEDPTGKDPIPWPRDAAATGSLLGDEEQCGCVRIQEKVWWCDAPSFLLPVEVTARVERRNV